MNSAPSRLSSIVATGLVCVISTLTTAADIHFPAEQWKTATADDSGWDEGRLNDAIDFAMSRRSSSVVVVDAGRIIAERHSDVRGASIQYSAMKRGVTSDGHPIEDVASVQKSIVCVLIGIAIDQGLLTLDDSVQKHLGVGWSHVQPDKEAAITLRHLVTMTSGLSTKLEFVAPPGTRWAYNTNAYAKSLTCLEAVTGKSADELTRDWLLRRIGMDDSKWSDRVWRGESDVDANRYGFVTSARDLARFGVLILTEGRWGDQTVVSREYLQSALTPSQEMNSSYGFLWWLNGQKAAIRGARKVAGPLNKSAPDDMVAALGALGRKCYVVPSLSLVVIRLGDNPDRGGEAKFDEEFWRRLISARKPTHAVGSGSTRQ